MKDEPIVNEVSLLDYWPGHRVWEPRYSVAGMFAFCFAGQTITDRFHKGKLVVIQPLVPQGIFFLSYISWSSPALTTFQRRCLILFFDQVCQRESRFSMLFLCHTNDFRTNGWEGKVILGQRSCFSQQHTVCGSPEKEIVNWFCLTLPRSLRKESRQICVSPMNLSLD